jgi:putative FmdB family regulatory protein
MPLYAYHCSSCEKAFRIYHKSTEIQVECINCKSDAIEKIIPQVRTVESKKKKTTIVVMYIMIIFSKYSFLFNH